MKQVGNRLLKLQSQYIGKKVLYLGTGTSILDLKLDQLDPEFYTFGFGRFIPFSKALWKDFDLDFYMCHDSLVFQSKFFDQFSNRKNDYKDEKYELDNSFLEDWDKSPAEFLIDNKVYEKTKIIYPKNSAYAHANRYSVKTNPEWSIENKQIIRNNENFLPYIADTGPSSSFFHFAEEQKDHLFLRNFAKNSFCNSALPVLLFLGFSEIYFAGVDYSTKGHFFCPAQSADGFKQKEIDDFNFLMNFSKELGHNPKFFSVKHKDTNICGKDGWVDFEEISK